MKVSVVLCSFCLTLLAACLFHQLPSSSGWNSKGVFSCPPSLLGSTQGCPILPGSSGGVGVGRICQVQLWGSLWHYLMKAPTVPSLLIEQEQTSVQFCHSLSVLLERHSGALHTVNFCGLYIFIFTVGFISSWPHGASTVPVGLANWMRRLLLFICHSPDTILDFQEQCRCSLVYIPHQPLRFPIPAPDSSFDSGTTFFIILM